MEKETRSEVDAPNAKSEANQEKDQIGVSVAGFSEPSKPCLFIWIRSSVARLKQRVRLVLVLS